MWTTRDWILAVKTIFITSTAHALAKMSSVYMWTCRDWFFKTTPEAIFAHALAEMSAVYMWTLRYWFLTVKITLVATIAHASCRNFSF